MATLRQKALMKVQARPQVSAVAPLFKNFGLFWIAGFLALKKCRNPCDLLFSKKRQYSLSKRGQKLICPPQMSQQRLFRRCLGAR